MASPKAMQPDPFSMRPDKGGWVLNPQGGGDVYDLVPDATTPPAVTPAIASTSLPAQPPKNRAKESGTKEDPNQYSVRKQRRRAKNPFGKGGLNKATDQAEIYYASATRIRLYGIAGFVVASCTLLALPLPGLFTILSISVSAVAPVITHLIGRNRNTMGDICLLLAADHMRVSAPEQDKARSRLLKLPHFKKLYGENGAGLNQLLRRYPVLARMRPYQTVDQDHRTGLYHGAVDRLKTEDARTKGKETDLEASLRENRDNATKERTRRDQVRQRGQK